MKEVKTITELIEALEKIRNDRGNIPAANACRVIVHGDEIDILGTGEDDKHIIITC